MLVLSLHCAAKKLWTAFSSVNMADDFDSSGSGRGGGFFDSFGDGPR